MSWGLIGCLWDALEREIQRSGKWAHLAIYYLGWVELIIVWLN